MYRRIRDATIAPLLSHSLVSLLRVLAGMGLGVALSRMIDG
jgi:ABC-type nitrate/sulfonate/bicarbonate transport system permease component